MLDLEPTTTMTNEQMIEWIDNASYEELLHKWRFIPIGHPMVMGSVGEHFKRVLGQRGEELSDGERVQASKNIGWGS